MCVCDLGQRTILNIVVVVTTKSCLTPVTLWAVARPAPPSL